MAQRTPVTRVSKGYTTFEYRNHKGEWQERRPNSTGWNKIRVCDPEQEVERCIARLEAQGFVREN